MIFSWIKKAIEKKKLEEKENQKVREFLTFMMNVSQTPLPPDVYHGNHVIMTGFQRRMMTDEEFKNFIKIYHEGEKKWKNC